VMPYNLDFQKVIGVIFVIFKKLVLNLDNPIFR